jgi:CubicO group peptidase (beta-lactamase class C family)
MTGIGLGVFWREHFAEPLGLDFWIGRPLDTQGMKPAPVFPPRGAPSAADLFYKEYGTPASLVNAAFMGVRGLNAVSAMNVPENQVLSLPAFGGVGTAAALAKFYAVLAGGGVWEDRCYLAHPNWCSETAVNGPDRILMTDASFSAGFMKDPVGGDGEKERHDFGPSQRAFGHPGAGGSLAFGDPDRALGFAYVMNQMEYGVLPNPKSRRLVRALYSL